MSATISQYKFFIVSCTADIYYTAVGLDNLIDREQTDRQTEKPITDATLIPDGSSG